jgi:hypothetical protein
MPKNMETPLENLSKEQLIQIIKTLYTEHEVLDIKNSTILDPPESNTEIEMLYCLVFNLTNNNVEDEIIDRFLKT